MIVGENTLKYYQITKNWLFHPFLQTFIPLRRGRGLHNIKILEDLIILLIGLSLYDLFPPICCTMLQLHLFDINVYMLN